MIFCFVLFCLKIRENVAVPPPSPWHSLDRTVEVFDPRLERWRVEERFGAGDGGRALTDACLVFQP